MATSIEWTDVTDNIIVVKGGGWWCRMISPGCLNCYAARLNQSPFFGGNKLRYTGETPELELRRDVIAGWARQRVPKKHFVASMTDVFGEWVEREWVFAFLDGMAAAPLQTFQVLTKRPAVAAREIAAWLESRGRTTLPDNIWMGTSVEDQQRANERIPLLLSIPAAVRFLSCEPLLGPLNLVAHVEQRGPHYKTLTGTEWLGPDEPRIHWVIAGGESGPGARPMHPDWARSVRDQCQIADVRFLFKQWGEWAASGPHNVQAIIGPSGIVLAENQRLIENAPKPGRTLVTRVGKKAAGRLLDARTHDEFPTLTAA